MRRAYLVGPGLVLSAAALNTLAAHAGARYLVPASLAGYVLAGGLLALPSNRLRCGRLLGLGVGMLVLGVGNLRGYADISGLMSPDQVSRVDEIHVALAALNQRGLTAGYADYWTAYPIAYLSGESVAVAPALPFVWGVPTDRYPAYTRQVDAVADPSHLFVLVDRRCASAAYLQALDGAGATYRVDDVARWLLIWDIHPPAGAERAALVSLRQAIAARQTC